VPRWTRLLSSELPFLGVSRNDPAGPFLLPFPREQLLEKQTSVTSKLFCPSQSTPSPEEKKSRTPFLCEQRAIPRPPFHDSSPTSFSSFRLPVASLGKLRLGRSSERASPSLQRVPQRDPGEALTTSSETKRPWAGVFLFYFLFLSFFFCLLGLGVDSVFTPFLASSCDPVEAGYYSSFPISRWPDVDLQRLHSSLP